MPAYDHLCKACNQEFEETYSIKVDPPKICPLCNAEGQVQRLISGIPSGTVKKEGYELEQHIKSERTKIKSQMKKDENFKANVIGETKYNDMVKHQEKINDRYKNI